MSLISAIIMASGFSRRMGENKLLMKYNNKFLIEYTLDVISKCNFKDKLIVTQYEKIKEIGENLDFKVVKNKYPNRGISESIKLGIKNCEESEGYMFFVGDQPLLDKKDIEKLINVFNEDTSFIVIPKYKNCFGNPVIYPKKYKEDILNLDISMHFRVRSAVFSVICRNCITVISIREKRSRQKNERSDRS